jgi:hypothetical protein
MVPDIWKAWYQGLDLARENEWTEYDFNRHRGAPRDAMREGIG